jgi:alkanesulfonate monooxygenase SsuD/methylene tetrahydromethanopterin reductase-like flavin-dependent oxidoreductase (luciferase family)
MEGNIVEFCNSTLCNCSQSSPQNPKDKSATKRKLQYWIDLAKLLERGGINALFLADTYGGYDTYEDSLDNCIRRAARKSPPFGNEVRSCPLAFCGGFPC